MVFYSLSHNFIASGYMKVHVYALYVSILKIKTTRININIFRKASYNETVFAGH